MDVFPFYWLVKAVSNFVSFKKITFFSAFVVVLAFAADQRSQAFLPESYRADFELHSWRKALV